ncbi:unnamed protein product [Cuscuta europaea]|uniref:Protein kinase domain-containing protein n=1 Tax=Cuscuta europaea TaxID=41803 RepID=A0A9P0ZV37_CUSEU|nr:unnamed protein product [Cuscuta europaea]
MSWIKGQIIGRGSSAFVSIAVSRHSGEIFAVKSAEISKSEFLRREQHILSNLNCPQIVEYRGYDVTSENNKIVFNLMMEYMPGGTLDGGRHDESSVCRYTRQIVQGLVYLHSNGIVHCDIKGSNVLLGEGGAAKIADFGCAKWLNPARDGRDLIAGTPLFMAPEVAQGKDQGFPADIWSLGCTIIEMATGVSPWPNFTCPATMLFKIAFSGELPPVPEFLSDQAKDFLMKCLKTNPKERWTAAQLIRHPFLEQFGNSEVQNQHSDSESPTSVLEKRIWSSAMENPKALRRTESFESPMQRVRELCSNSEIGSEEDADWITVRRRAEEGIASEQNVLVRVSCCNGRSTGLSLLGQTVVGNCQKSAHQKERVVNQLPLFYISSSSY